MTLRDLMRLHAGTVLSDPDYTGEEATYHFASGDPDRTVRCDVDRIGRVQDGEGKIALLAAVVFVPRDATFGITTLAPGDEMTLPMVEEETPLRVQITEVIAIDPAGFQFEVRAI